MLDVALLGCGGMMPMPGRFLSSVLMRLNGRLIMVDCGEGTQVTLKELGWGFKAIDAILFTHYHADHISGLPGMLLTIGNSGRTLPLQLIGPPGLSYIVDGLRRVSPELPFDIEYIELDRNSPRTFQVGMITVSFTEAEHLVKCYSYRFDVKRKGKFNTVKAKELGIPRILWNVIQKNGFAEYEGKTFTSDMVMGGDRKGISVSFCTDTRPLDSFIDFIQDSDLFICEGMYGEEEKREKALKNRHMLFSEAASLAKRGNVGKLWLTHFSPSLSEPEEFKENATGVFENTVIGFDRMTDTIYFPENREEKQQTNA